MKVTIIQILVDQEKIVVFLMDLFKDKSFSSFPIIYKITHPFTWI